MLTPLRSPWRAGLEGLLNSVRSELLIAAPYVTANEAAWVCRTVTKHTATGSVHARVMTDMRSDSVLNGSLDISALMTFLRVMPGSVVVSVPRLHAKVYVADETMAVVTSANLTTAGLDSNYEYGVAIREPSVIRQIRSDMEAYGRIGSTLAHDMLANLAAVGSELSTEYQQLQRSLSSGIRQRFEQSLRQANMEFLKAFVGTRTANSLFSEAMVYLLSERPMATHELHPRMQALLPDLCDDSVELIINGERFGKRWKHAVRNAQQYLKRQGAIGFADGRWALVSQN